MGGCAALQAADRADRPPPAGLEPPDRRRRVPSGHSATVTALAAAALLQYGAASFQFAISAVLAIIVMHDAMGVRWQAGQHARTINELLLKLSDTPPEQLLEEFLGHTPLQVACGALLGAAVAILYSLP